MNKTNNQPSANKITTMADMNKLNLFQAIVYDKKELVKVLLLIVYTILLIMLYVKNPYEIVTNYTNLILGITAFSSLYIYYINIKDDEKIVNFKFDIFKYIIILVSFITTVSYLYNYNPGGYIISTYSLPIIMLLVSACSLIICYLFLFISLSTSPNDTTYILKNDQAIFVKFIMYFLVISFGTIASILFIQYILGLVADASSVSGIVKMIVNIFIVIILLAIIFRMITYTDFYKDSPLAQLILNTIFYIPCLFISSTDKIVTAVQGVKGAKAQKSATQSSDYILLVIAITLNVAYYVYPYIANFYAKQGGLLLVNMPVFTDSEYTLGSYIDLNGSDSFDYTFALSFWVYIDAASPSVSANSAKYVSLLNYGNKPNVLYNVVEHTLMVTMTNPYSTEETTEKRLILDENGNVIIYKMKDVLLQKWNNIIINYNGGTLDIFYNSELVKSFPRIVPYMNYDSLTIGENNGVKGGICNVNFFKEPVNMSQIYHLYNYVKDKTPPVYTNNDQTIINIVNKV